MTLFNTNSWEERWGYQGKSFEFLALKRLIFFHPFFFFCFLSLCVPWGRNATFGNQINSLCYRAKIFVLHIRSVGFVLALGLMAACMYMSGYWVSGPSEVLKPCFRVRQDVVYIPGASMWARGAFYSSPWNIYCLLFLRWIKKLSAAALFYGVSESIFH